mgnify:FL=1
MLLLEKQNNLSDLLNNDLWVDWVNNYQDNLKNLDLMSRKERNDEVQKYVQSIGVSFDKDKRTHNLKLRLKLPLIGDNLEYKDEKKKFKGYKITEGGHNTVVHLPSKVKNVSNIR